MFYYLNPPGGSAVYPYTLTDMRLANPGVKFPVDITDAIAAEYHCFPVQPTTPDNAPTGKKAVRAAPELVDGMWFERWALADLTADETAAQWSAVRAERNGKLAACDWTQLADSPQKTIDKWLIYRQALRDITKSAGFPDAIKWPEAPSA